MFKVDEYTVFTIRTNFFTEEVNYMVSTTSMILDNMV